MALRQTAQAAVVAFAVLFSATTFAQGRTDSLIDKLQKRQSDLEGRVQQLEKPSASSPRLLQGGKGRGGVQTNVGPVSLELHGFVDVGGVRWPKELAAGADHHTTSVANSQNTVTFGTGKQFLLNEVRLEGRADYEDIGRGVITFSWYPSVQTRLKEEWTDIQPDNNAAIADPRSGRGKFGAFDFRRIYLERNVPWFGRRLEGWEAKIQVGKIDSLLGIVHKEFYQANISPTIAVPYHWSAGYPTGVAWRNSYKESTLDISLTHDAHQAYGITPADRASNQGFAINQQSNRMFGYRLAQNFGDLVSVLGTQEFTLGVSGQTGTVGRRDESNRGHYDSFVPFGKWKFDPFPSFDLGPITFWAEWLRGNRNNLNEHHPNGASGVFDRWNLLYRPADDFGATSMDGDPKLRQQMVYGSMDFWKEKLSVTGGYGSYWSEGRDQLNPATNGETLWKFMRGAGGFRYKMTDNIQFKAEYLRAIDQSLALPNVRHRLTVFSLIFEF